LVSKAIVEVVGINGQVLDAKLQGVNSNLQSADMKVEVLNAKVLAAEAILQPANRQKFPALSGVSGGKFFARP
jgi:hypothetical protein